ncbi:MAG TPA: CHAT domain-containing protein [Thermoanaerobaculia bacterium]
MAAALLLLVACGAPRAEAPAQSNNAELKAEAERLIATASEQMDRGNHGAAAVTLEKAIGHYQKLKDPFEESVAWTMLSQVYTALGAHEKGEAAFRKALALNNATDSATGLAGLEVFKTSNIASKGGPSSAFLRSFDDELELFPGGALMFDHFWPMFDALSEITINGSLTTTETASTRSYMSRRRMLDLLALMEGRDRFAEGKLSMARDVWKMGLDKSINSDLRSGFQAGIGATYFKEGNHDEAIRWFKLAADSAEEPLQGIKNPDLVTSYIGSERRWYYDITIDTLLKNNRPEEAFDYSERSRARAFLQMVGNDCLRGQRQRSNAEYASLSTIQPVRLDDVRRELPEDTTLIVYFVSTYGVRAFVIDREQLNYAALPFDRLSLERMVEWATSFRAAAARGMTPDGPSVPPIGTAEEAFSLLIEPLRKYIRNPRLLVVPHGDLHYVPFAALRDKARDRYLVEDYVLIYSPSASALRFLEAKETPVEGRALVIGNPDSGLPALPGSAREATTVAREFGTTPIIGSQASEDLLYRLGGQIDLLHVAAHGQFDAVKPLRSHLALAKSATHDGKLEVQEILSDLDLGGVNLVVLSACQTAAGQRGGGDDVVGLTRAILYAGSPGVISTLWDIDDASSAVLMAELYRRLRTGTPAAEALREAQLSMLRSKVHADPALWAAFTLTGDPRGNWKSAP